VARQAHEHRDRLRAWALRLERKLGHNKAAVALANKLARIAWGRLEERSQSQPTYISAHPRTLLDKHSDGETGPTGIEKADNKPGL
jgi:hypothetical protein